MLMLTAEDRGVYAEETGAEFSKLLCAGSLSAPDILFGTCGGEVN